MDTFFNNVVVTGGAGFIGSHTVDLLIDKNISRRVIVIDNLYSGDLANISRHLNSGRLILYRRDIRDKRIINELSTYKDIDGIIHLAAVVGVDEARENPWLAVTTNIIGTLNMLEYARRNDIERIVYASSAAVYGEPIYIPIDENHPLNPVNLYGETKLMGEKLLWRYYHDYDLKPIALRYFNVYGPRMRPGPYSGVIYKFIEALINGKNPIIYGDGSQTRDFIYVRDVAEANILALQSKHVDAVNIASGKELSINELYRIICRLINKCPKPLYKEKRPGDIYRSTGSIEKALKLLNWRPKYDLVKGLHETIKYYLNKALPG